MEKEYLYHVYAEHFGFAIDRNSKEELFEFLLAPSLRGFEDISFIITPDDEVFYQFDNDSTLHKVTIERISNQIEF